MGKTIRAQRIGKGSPKYRAPGHRYKGAVKHQALYLSREEQVKGKVLDIVHDSGRSAPIAQIRYEDNKTGLIIAPSSLRVGSEVYYGRKANPVLGSSLYLADIPEGTLVYNVESAPGDGGKFGRASGTFIKVVTHDPRGTVIQLPSGAFKTMDNKCRANIGSVAGSGRLEKPFVKAGVKHYRKKARGKYYPRVKGLAMNPVDHPFGGGGHPHIGKAESVSRHAPPGRKIGSISPRRSGKKGRK